VFPQGCQF
jgi:hypothetical protein